MDFARLGTHLLCWLKFLCFTGNPNREQFYGRSNNLAPTMFLYKESRAGTVILRFPGGSCSFEDSAVPFRDRLFISWGLPVCLRTEQIPKWEGGNESKLPLKKGVWEEKGPHSFDLNSLIRSANTLCFQFWSHSQWQKKCTNVSHNIPNFWQFSWKKLEALETLLISTWPQSACVEDQQVLKFPQPPPACFIHLPTTQASVFGPWHRICC